MNEFKKDNRPLPNEKDCTERRLSKNPTSASLKPERDNDNREENKPAQTVPHVFWESVERLLDERSPNCFDETRDGRVGNETKDDGGERLHDPSMAKIHHPKMRAARVKSFKWRSRL